MSQSKTIATVDLGSNSFHLLISEITESGQIKEWHIGKSKVQLRAGLKDNGILTEEAKTRALDCLKNFALSLDHYNVDEIKVVGTYTLRQAKNYNPEFIQQAETILGCPIQVVTGEEEARLVYIGATKKLKSDNKVLIIDVGGGSTELVVGHNKDIKKTVSLDMGCVSVQNDFFANQEISLSKMAEAVHYAKSMIQPISAEFMHLGWSSVIGSSGTVRSIANIAKASKWSNGQINKEVLEKMASLLLEKRLVTNIDFSGLKEDRRNILVGGFCVLYALFETFHLKKMQAAKGALREGMLYEVITSMYGQ
jgi:exopolyphosphatase/guanosine-5'-triphosphate,3'-diphosphate pyrophosphatase